MRSTKPCGPDTPTLVSSSRRSSRATVTKTPGTPRRARYKSSNIARGMPDVFGCTCETLVCVLLRCSCTRDARVQRRPAFPAPSVFQRASTCLGQIMSRECEVVAAGCRVGKAQACPPLSAPQKRWARRKRAFAHPTKWHRGLRSAFAHFHPASPVGTMPLAMHFANAALHLPPIQSERSRVVAVIDCCVGQGT